MSYQEPFHSMIYYLHINRDFSFSYPNQEMDEIWIHPFPGLDVMRGGDPTTPETYLSGLRTGTRGAARRAEINDEVIGQAQRQVHKRVLKS